MVLLPGIRAPVSKQSILNLWESREYEEVYALCETALLTSPMDSFYLTFKGFSAFYLGVMESDGEKRMLLTDESIFALRKALIDTKVRLRAQIYYILGKAYFHKGTEYCFESIEYLCDSIEYEYFAPDIWEYLALAAQQAGRIDDSLVYYDNAVMQNPAMPELLLAAGMINNSVGNTVKAETLALKAFGLTDDDYLAESCRFLLGDIYLKTDRLDDAMNYYNEILDKNPQSADTWYQKGLVFAAKNDPVQARAAYRRALAIDPMHAGSRVKLAER
jgi:tetratricopeptide (TPR) repeat protein